MVGGGEPAVATEKCRIAFIFVCLFKTKLAGAAVLRGSGTSGGPEGLPYCGAAQVHLPHDVQEHQLIHREGQDSLLLRRPEGVREWHHAIQTGCRCGVKT